jgi:hypothetical protein
MLESGFTILFTYEHQNDAPSFTINYHQFQGWVTYVNEDHYKITRLHKYDVYEMIELIGSYELQPVRSEAGDILWWKDVRTNDIGSFIQTMGSAILTHLQKPALQFIY